MKARYAMRLRRSPSSITLVLIGTAALNGCGGEETARRDVYRSQLDCQRDWGATPGGCEPVRSGAHSGYYYGPRYRDDGQHRVGTTSLPRTGSNAIGTAHLARSDSGHTATSSSSPHSPGTARGGFGSSASAHSSGG